jgi:putative tryptophan/tyrosine transport system substrate-binding protein
MFSESSAATRGALAAYGINYRGVGRLSAKQVQRILQGALPGELPVEQLDKPHLVLNLRTAKAIGVTIPQSVLVRADEVIQ